jgi:hypothetical protein
VLTADDVVESRGERKGSPRDNVLFELGLFMGHIGRPRTFFISDRGARIMLPTDLAGITYAELVDRRDRPDAAVGPACTRIISAIRHYAGVKGRSTRAFTKDELIRGRWIKVADHGNSFLVEFLADGSLVEANVTKPAETWGGEWELDAGHLVIKIKEYSLRVAASRDSAVHSGLETNTWGGSNAYRMVHADWTALSGPGIV